MISFKELINPLNKRVNNLIDFETKPQKNNNNDLIKDELPYLKEIVDILGNDAVSKNARLKKIRQELEEIIYIIENTTGDDKSDAVGDYNKQFSRAQLFIKLLNRTLKQLDQPYFGKIIFNRKNGVTKDGSTIPQKEITTYIGRFALFDKNTNKMLITDWRAPIANLYYQNSGPKNNLQFKTPIGKQTGDLEQKRQFEISEARIDSIYEAKTGNASADQFLLSQLQKRIGKKLQDIISTIQEEQNNIIRDDMNKTIILQGVAGSGKTTILLHRIAYLLYKHKDNLKSQNMLVIAPNKMFLDYISDVLPSLGVDEIGRNTYITWAKNILNWDNSYIASTSKDNLKIKKLKGSKKFINLINNYIKNFEDDLFSKMPKDPLNLIIEQRFNLMKEKHPELNLEQQLNLSLDYAFAQLQFKNKTTGDFMGRLEMQNSRKKKIRSYMKKRLNPLKIYRDLYKQTKIFKNSGFTSKEINEIKTHTLKNFKKVKGGIQKYKVEDIAPILSIHLNLFGKKEHLKDYVVVDEAQDLSPYQIKTIYSISKNKNLLLAGDIAQSIVPPFYFKKWTELEEILKEDSLEYYNLKRCYRTTVEIIEYAQKLFRDKMPKEYQPEAVLRHGEEVGKIEHSKESEKMYKLVQAVKDSINKGSVTTAILTKDYNSADKLFNKFKNYKDKNGQKLADTLDKQILSYKTSDYRNGVLVMPIENAKGLEFDTVIISDREKYDLSKALDIRLLYVAITRALHRLTIFTKKS